MIALLLALPVPVVSWDFAVSDHGFLPSGDVDQWEHGPPVGGPGGAGALWGTNLAGFYLNDSVDYLEVPLPDVSLLSQPTLVFRHWHALASGDAAWIEIDQGFGWTRADPAYGYPVPSGFVGASDWTTTAVPLPSGVPNVRVRFAFSADTTIADDGWYLSDVSLWDGDAAPPRVTPLLEPTHTQNLAGPYRVQALVEDDSALSEVSLSWSLGGPEVTVPMQDLGDGVYQGSIPGQPPDTEVSWQMTARDASGNAVTLPASPATFRVFLAAPLGLVVSHDERPIGDRVTLSWKPPPSPHPVRTYVVQDLGGKLEPLSVKSTSVELSVTPTDPQLWRVAARYDGGLGDWSNTVDLDLEVPALASLTPATAIQGETIHLELTGSSLYLLDGTTTLGLGPGVEVLDLDVRDVNTLSAVVAVHGSAPPGHRDLTVVGAQGAAVFEDAFTILDQALAMRVVSVEPGAVVQGEEVTLTITASEPFAGPVTIQHADDLVVQSAPVLDGDQLTVALAVKSSATPGVHTLVLDDGARMLQAHIRVDERIYQVSTGGCSAAPAAGGSFGLLGPVVLLLRRRRGRRSVADSAAPMA